MNIYHYIFLKVLSVPSNAARYNESFDDYHAILAI